MNALSLHQFGWYLRNVLLSEAGPELLKPAVRALAAEKALGTPADTQEEQDSSYTPSRSVGGDVGGNRRRAVEGMQTSGG